MPSPATDLMERFCNRVDASIAYQLELLAAVNGKRRQAALETMLSEQFTISTLVSWEVFLSDLILQYLAMGPSRYSNAIEDKLLQSARDKFGPRVAGLITVAQPTITTVTQARAFADHKNFNITANSAGKLAERANELLEAPHAMKFTLGPDDSTFIDYIISLRNFLAHRSAASRSTFKDSMAKLTVTNASFMAPASNIGSYLKTRNQQQETRAVIIARKIVLVARTLA